MATPDSMDGMLQLLARRMREHPGSLGSHRIRLDLRGAGGGVWTLQTGAAGVSLVSGEGDGVPSAEVIADVAAIKPVLEGRQDGRAAFLAGGIRVRGDVLAITQLSAVLGTHQPSAVRGGGNG
jgi:SCP-2 sterol transfer family